MIDYEKLHSLAVDIAKKAHEGQVDKAGKPYILHPIRVAEMCNDVRQKIVAILHDTIEDTYVTPEYLKIKGFDDEIINAVLAVTRRKGESYEEFIERCNCNVIGKMVKINDLKDNLDITRLDSISEKDIARINKYLKSYRKLSIQI